MGLVDSIAALLGKTDGQDRVRHHEDLLTSLLVMAWMVEARDPYTGGHLWRVPRFARQLATEAGLPAADVARITIGGFLHDLGKVSIPDRILGKKDRLTEAEYEVIKTHPEVGWRMLAGYPLAALAEAAVRGHHETPDGRGYPRGLRGMPIGKALDIIEENLDRQFDREQGRRFVDEGIPLHECVMCGPTLVTRRGQLAGEHIYCRSCSGEYLTEAGPDGGLTALPTGRMGTAKDLEPEADTALIVNIVRESARALLASPQLL